MQRDGCDDAESGGGDETQSERAAWIDCARRSLEESIPEVARKLAQLAREGSVAHMKLLLQLLGLDNAGFVAVEAGKREKTLEEILLEEWHKEP